MVTVYVSFTTMTTQRCTRLTGSFSTGGPDLVVQLFSYAFSYRLIHNKQRIIWIKPNVKQTYLRLHRRTNSTKFNKDGVFVAILKRWRLILSNLLITDVAGVSFSLLSDYTNISLFVNESMGVRKYISYPCLGVLEVISVLGLNDHYPEAWRPHEDCFHLTTHLIRSRWHLLPHI